MSTCTANSCRWRGETPLSWGTGAVLPREMRRPDGAPGARGPARATSTTWNSGRGGPGQVPLTAPPFCSGAIRGVGRMLVVCVAMHEMDVPTKMQHVLNDRFRCRSTQRLGPQAGDVADWEPGRSASGGPGSTVRTRAASRVSLRRVRLWERLASDSGWGWLRVASNHLDKHATTGRP